MDLIFIGKEWKFEDYLTIDLIKKIKPSKIEFLDHIDIEFSPTNNAIIVCNTHSYPLTAKVLATLTNQILEVKDNFLVPNRVEFTTNSFLIEYKHILNVILVKKEIPKILLPLKEFEEINIFKFDKDSAINFLSPILEKHKISYSIIENYGFIKFITPKLSEEIKNEITSSIPFTIIGDIPTHIIKTLPPKKITFAESCTGGLLASTLTKIANSSRVFDGSVVTYSNYIKHEWLGVENLTLEKYGAVSEQTVKEMLLGAIEIAKSDYAIAISGIAGPSGGTPKKPVGLVYIGVADNKSLKIEEFRFKGDRNYIQHQAMMNAFRMFINFANLYS